MIPLTVAFGLFTPVIVPVPLKRVQVPVPIAGALPTNVTVVPQIFISAPALDTVGGAMLLIVTSSLAGVQGGLETVQRITTLVPDGIAVIVDVALLTFVIVAVPDTTLHVPVPAVGVLPANVADVAHIVWSVPALAAELPEIVIVTSSVEGVHGVLAMLQRNTMFPILNPVKVDVGLLVDVIVPVPETIVQVPVPITAVFAANVVDVPQMVWFDPASATLGEAFVMIVTSSLTAVHGGLETVQRITTLVPAGIPVIVDVGLLTLVIVAEPDTTLQIPVPAVGVLPANVADVAHIV